MKFNFFFISYSVIYAKYNHCYEIPRDMPIRYFDGKEWKFMKPRHNFRTKAPRYTNISTELDWADLNKEIKEIELQETTTQMPPTCARTKTQIRTTEKTTTETTTRKKTTIKKTTTKMTTPKSILCKIRPLTKPTTTTKAAVKHSLPRCKLKLKTTTTTTSDPRIWQMKMLTSEDWLHAWTHVRPTKKPSLITTKKHTTKKILPVTRTKKPGTITKAPGTTEKPVKLSGIQGDDENGPENWSNLMREFLKFVEAKKCRPPCEYETRTTIHFSGYKLGDKRIRPLADDLTNILMDGVKIDDKLSDVGDDASQGQAIMRWKEKYEADGEEILNFDSVEGSVSKINNDSVQDLDHKSLKDSVKVRRIKQDNETAQHRRKIELLKELKSKNLKQDHETPRVSQSEAYFDKLKVKNATEMDEVLQDREMNSYLDVLKDKHTLKENEPEKKSEIKSYLDAKNARHTGKAQDKVIRKHLDAVKNMYTQRYTDNSQYVSKDTLNFKELNLIADYVATKRTYSTDSTEIRNDNEDYLQDRDITFDLGTLDDHDHEKADKYSSESIEVRESDVYAYADTINDINEQNDDKTIKSYEKVIPLFNFKYALNENMKN